MLHKLSKQEGSFIAKYLVNKYNVEQMHKRTDTNFLKRFIDSRRCSLGNNKCDNLGFASEDPVYFEKG